MGISERLKEERARLKLSQADFALAGGAHRKSQGNYESGERSPDSAYLEGIAAIGADIQYIVTGIRSDVALTPDERELLSLFRAASLAVKAAAIGALKGGSGGMSSQRFVFHSDVGQVTNVEGDLTHEKPTTVNVGRKKK
ncbi:transcriptional regulator [Azospira sp. I13]|nr:transcriptional regulator [Azospira sp. I13]